MSHSRTPVDRLHDDECDRVRGLVRELGSLGAAKALGLYSELTVLKAAMGVPVHALTVSTIRARLGARAAA